MASVSAVASAANNDSNQSGVSWSALFAGAAGAAALSYVLVVLGFALGLSSVSPWGQGAQAATIGIATILWLTFTQIAASAVGGYLAGRLRVKWTAIHSDEVFFRDTAHGFLSWAIASLAVAAFLASAVSAIVSGGAAVAGTALSGTGSAAMAAVSKAAPGASDPSAYFVDTLFRTQPSASPSAPDDRAARAEAVRIFATDIPHGSLTDEDKHYLGQVVAARTGLAPADAEQRVDTVFKALQQSLDSAKTKAKQAADEARKVATGLSLWMVFSLFCGAFCASVAAVFGGRRRDSHAVLVQSLP